MSERRNRRILVIDDNKAIHDDFRKILGVRSGDGEMDSLEAKIFGLPQTAKAANEHYELQSAYQGKEGFECVRRSVEEDRRFALAFVDMRMPPGWDGLQTIEKIWSVDPDIQIVICTAYSDYSWEEILSRFGAADRLLILKKPFDTAEVCQLACALTEKWHLAKHAHLKLGQLNAMVAEQTQQLQERIEQHERTEERLRASEDRYALAAAASNGGLWDWNLERGVVYYSPRWKQMLDLDDAITDSPEEWMSRIHPDDRPLVQAKLDAHLSGEVDHFQAEYRMARKDGHYCWLLCRGLAVRDAAGKAVRVAGSQTDISDRKVAEEQLRHDALHDALTGLPNRALLTDRLERCMLRAARDQGVFALLFVDLDRFKLVNDGLGHIAGDRLLIEITKRLLACVREMDSVARPEMGDLARFGGDEFVLLLDKIHDPANAMRVAERIQKALAEPVELNGHEVSTSASMGIVLAGPLYGCPEDILRDADTALYQAKAAGGGRFVIFDRKMHDSAMAKLRMENELRRVFDRKELRLYFQPIVSLQTGEVTELEALVRWQHPQRGVIPPAEFISVAEEIGLIVPLGNWVLREACTCLRRWETNLPGLHPLSINVNVSGKQFTQSDLATEIETVLKETGVRPEQLHLEITETAAMECAARTTATLDRLRAMNLQLHLDDFGTGYSSLSHIHRMPVSALKIDRSFISNMNKDASSRSIVQAIVALAHSLKMRVIAEGVETAGQLDYLRSIQCDSAQGYFFARPLPAAQVTEFLSMHPHCLLSVGA